MMTQCLAASASIHIFTSSRLSLLSKEIYLHSKTPIFPPVQCRGVFCSDSTVHGAPALQDRCQCTLHTLPPTLLLYTPVHTLQLQAVLSNHTLHHVSLSCHDITIHCIMSPHHAMTISRISSPHTVKTLLPRTTGGINPSGHYNAVNGVSG